MLQIDLRIENTGNTGILLNNVNLSDYFFLLEKDRTQKIFNSISSFILIEPSDKKTIMLQASFSKKLDVFVVKYFSNQVFYEIG